MEENKVVIVDCDPGIDDAMALFLCFAQNLNVIAITIVHGNLSSEAGVAQLGANAARILKMINRTEVPVYLGETKPLTRDEHGGAAFVHGNDGMGDVIDASLSCENDVSIKNGAVSFIAEEIMKREENSVILISLGPMTNLAKALQTQPLIADRIHCLYTMGGCFFCPGNISPNSEGFFTSSSVILSISLFCGLWNNILKCFSNFFSLSQCL